MVQRAMIRFFRLESAGGILLVAAAALALVFDNSTLSSLYDALLTLPVSFSIGTLGLSKPLVLWINDGLMAIFFLLVGLELKREILEGELSSRAQILLPSVAALGGIIAPATFYVALNGGDVAAMRGWAVPVATDIAFALGVLSLLGSRVPVGLKVFLTAMAIIDDLGALVIIAAFYTADLSLLSFILAGAAILVLLALNRLGVTSIAAYMLVGIALWLFVLKSGVHATLAGVILGLVIPLRPGKAGGASPLRHLEHILHPWVSYGVMPLFAFANAGIHLGGLSLAELFAPVPLGIAAGLFVGKQLGVFGASWLVIRTGLARLPEGVTWCSFYAVSVLTGIGFTMSLFIAGLAFGGAPALAAQARLGILAGSIISALAGFFLLRWALRTAAPAKA